ncbi:hypothetical protein [Curtobacterium sp. VKM Ac-2922]|uniref:hypothetical protein n=1 Tax=Curtobacterium sp. VKM Ac-2922 TaxID=2929475 RepID=UPI001FB548C5|nr:hypothetical protein [Curtobacterium sp. VKM Ac-2922]MCJ1712816.1 hypothetical protein [Curtobacterium sp. VKM Ac-2922]
MHITNRAAKTGTLALVIVGLAASVVHGLPEPADVAIAPTTDRDPGAWTMPLDGYVQPGGRKDTYALNLVTQPCLRAAGIGFPVPWATTAGLDAVSDQDETPERGNTSPALAWSEPLDAETARTRGYHGPSTVGANEDGMKAWGENPKRNAAFADASERVTARCFRQGYRTLGTADAGGAVQAASTVAKRLTYLAATAAREDDTVVAAAAKWHACMAPAELADLPATPNGMPSQSIRMDYGTDIASTPVQDPEIAIATRDVACQQSSGYRGALYDAEWSRLLHVTASDASVLRKAEADQIAVDRRLDATIHRLAPAAPTDVD